MRLNYISVLIFFVDDDEEEEMMLLEVLIEGGVGFIVM